MKTHDMLLAWTGGFFAAVLLVLYYMVLTSGLGANPMLNAIMLATDTIIMVVWNARVITL